jgi:lysozyme
MNYALSITAVLASACAVDEVSLGESTQAMSVCADGPTTYGIDVSRFQGDINWDQVAGSGVKFAFIQISRSLTDLDAKFTYNWRRAKEVGILRGAYQRFRPGMDVMGQAKIFVDTLGPFQKGDLPPMLDVEDADGLSATQIANRVQQWLDYVEPKVGVRPLIYTGFYFWRDSVGGADFKQYPLWIANYSATCPLVPPTWTRWAFHQYSSTATIPGVTANTVDVNKFNGTLDQLKALGEPPPPPPPDEEPPADDDTPKDVDGSSGDYAAAEGGCSTSKGLSLWFVVAGIFLRRRRAGISARDR